MGILFHFPFSVLGIFLVSTSEAPVYVIIVSTRLDIRFYIKLSILHKLPASISFTIFLRLPLSFHHFHYLFSCHNELYTPSPPVVLFAFLRILLDDCPFPILVKNQWFQEYQWKTTSFLCLSHHSFLDVFPIVVI